MIESHTHTPAAEVVGVDVLAVDSASSSNRACSGLVAVRIGGAGARRLFERRFLSNNGPSPDAAKDMHKNSKFKASFSRGSTFFHIEFANSQFVPEVDEIGCIDAIPLVGIGAGDDVLAVDVKMILVECAVELTGGEPTNVVVIVGIVSSAGVLRSDESFDRRLTNSVRRSSSRPMRCDIRCISRRESTFISRTVAIRSRCANVLDCSRKPLSYVSEVVSRSMEEAFSSGSRAAAAAALAHSRSLT